MLYLCYLCQFYNNSEASVSVLVLLVQGAHSK